MRERTSARSSTASVVGVDSLVDVFSGARLDSRRERGARLKTSTTFAVTLFVFSFATVHANAAKRTEVRVDIERLGMTDASYSRGELEGLVDNLASRRLRPIARRARCPTHERVFDRSRHVGVEPVERLLHERP
jgi:hypothetical protein